MSAESKRQRMMILTNRLSCLSVGGLLVVLAVPAAAQSFNCHKAFFADERTICREPPLGRLDSELATLFGHVSSRLPPPQRAALSREETAWVVARRRCGDDGRCIADFYGRRIQRLDAMLAATEPEQSLAAHPLARAPLPPQQRAVEKREPPAVASTSVHRAPGNGASNTAVSGSTAPVTPPHDFDIEPEVSPARSGGSDGSAGGPMTPAR
jgi:uncharacterized protein